MGRGGVIKGKAPLLEMTTLEGKKPDFRGDLFWDPWGKAAGGFKVEKEQTPLTESGKEEREGVLFSGLLHKGRVPTEAQKFHQKSISKKRYHLRKRRSTKR